MAVAVPWGLFPVTSEFLTQKVWVRPQSLHFRHILR